ncbi:hypothetical protein [Halomontanus rarus]|uniref:hypothetical protein n=1 Tax=Halomontanus rarus TaxID=3034020 RepID=UPI00307B8A9B
MFNTAGIDVFNQDWDNLILLDACRYDIFEETNSISGQLQKKESRGAMTREFLRGNLIDKDLTDVVYVTANPMLYRDSSEISVEFHNVINVWQDDGWDETESTVLPETMTQHAIQADRKYPNKRLFIHYLQPHYPFIGHDLTSAIPDPAVTENDIWTRKVRGDDVATKEEIWSAYQNNLELALESVKELLDVIEGKCIVTSDHGNLFDERVWPLPNREWGHPNGIYVSQLVDVPWLEVPFDSRKSIKAEKSESTTITEESKVIDRLEQLGYK